jgi:peptide/nickel transport system permease protein
MFPVRFFTRSSPGQNGRAPSGLHLFGVDGPATLHLAGTDASGRDVFSRLLFGGRISLIAGIVGAAVSVVLGALFGSFAGYFGGWLDEAVMATSEVFLSVPWLYLLLVVRALLPLHVEATRIFLLLVVVLGCVGWARPARLVRGVVLSAKRRDYVTAAKGFGASHAYLLRTHVLPAAASVIYTQFALYVPQYVLAEVTLSFFGLGVSEPAPSWGNMLASLQRNYVLQSCWWMFAPALALILVFTGYRRLLLSHTEVPPLI